jgi:hypothetical protein
MFPAQQGKHVDIQVYYGFIAEPFRDLAGRKAFSRP